MGWILSGLVLGSLTIAPPTPALSIPIQAGSPATEQHFQRGVEAYNSSDYSAAIAAWEKALAGVRAEDDREGETDALNNLGLAYSALGQYQRAVGFYEQALALVRAAGDRGGEASPGGNLGIAYYALGDYPMAIVFHLLALEVARLGGDRRSV
ncbi:MAG: tetratricopeptide repeat protein, partial [Cyanophyceae cyanobacterium]